MPVHSVSFHDADFEHRFFWCRSEDGTPIRRWLPFGMPRLNPNLQRAVVFVYGHSPKTGVYGVRGTGVIIGLPCERERPYIHHYYAVTSQHVIDQRGHDLRVNTKEGKTRPIKIAADKWQSCPGGYDLSAVDITEEIEKRVGHDEVSAIPERLLLSEKFAAEVEFGLGEDGFMLGLFSNLPGKSRNLVTARFGNVAMLAAADDPVEQGNGITRPCHVFDIRSRPGYSGSPVFVYRTKAADLRDITYGPEMAHLANDLPPEGQKLYRNVGWERDLQENIFLRILGIHSAQYRDEVEVSDVLPNGQSGPARKMLAPNSMTVVVPSWEVSTFLTKHKPFLDQRLAREEMEKAKEKESGGSAEPEATDDASGQKKPDNPRHREDFRGLLNAAARKKRQAD